MEINKIYNEDCLVGMKKIPEVSTMSDSTIGASIRHNPFSYLPIRCPMIASIASKSSHIALRYRKKQIIS